MIVGLPPAVVAAATTAVDDTSGAVGVVDVLGLDGAEGESQVWRGPFVRRRMEDAEIRWSNDYGICCRIVNWVRRCQR